MADIDKALATQLANIEKKYGKTLAELGEVVLNSGLSKHGELVSMLKTTYGMGHGDANTVVHVVRQSAAQTAAEPPASTEDALAGIYTGPKELLRPIHERLLAEIRAFGPFEEAPKKAYVSYRRSKQFAMIGPATNTRLEVGLNVRGLTAGDRLLELPAGQMCQFKVKLTQVDEVDAELLGWIRAAYDASA